ncbi:hypothetical protein BD324DRAFT_651897 [Kockovaella imperatae]|uniref:SH3 domain-containing protein n=1 Tax=Kockovaella imperatae TaxID=4999 RepID=A0A1Y1UEN0_9TREE|nr:hypothetical protein BD324DRAFT_651897 [Kockovaella imperatae]ORX35987.1 hypothetical protein BD324DRAFT_651897 [Kockovaella imperatae]
MPFSSLPLEVVSHIASLLQPPWAPGPITETSYTDTVDPQPPSDRLPVNDISAFSRSSHITLQAARPWLWENVDVKSGRGWLAIVNALTEEVVDIKEIPASPDLASSQQPGFPWGPVSPEQAHAQPATLSLARYIAPPVTYPTPYATASNVPIQGLPYSPQQPSHAALLLTPPASRNVSPSPLVSARLRGRSRSPRRSLGLEGEGISAVLDRSRSLSLHRTASWRSDSGSVRRPPMPRRRTSLSRSRTMPVDGEYDEEEDEDEDEVPPLRGEETQSVSLDDSEDESDHQNELLPPPGPYIRHLSFNNFRTVGSRRTQDEAVRGRFVTAGRLEGVIKNAPNLVSLCMTEYVDSSLTLPVLEEMVFRGYRQSRGSLQRASRSRGRSLSIDPTPVVAPTFVSQTEPNRPTYVPYETETEEQKWRRRSLFTALEALDLTGCVSSVFNEAMSEFWETWYAPEETRGRGRRRHRLGEAPSSTDESDEDTSVLAPQEPTSRRIPRFYIMKRLSLRSCTTLPPQIISDFVCSFPNLTHLDLSGTRVPSTFLSLLIERPPMTLRFQSLSLARCPRLHPSIVVDFLKDSPCARDLIELNLYATPTQSNCIGPEDAERMLSAPCFKSGKLRYLDISGAGMEPRHLIAIPNQPSLISLGMSHMPLLSVISIQEFLLNKAPHVEVLTLTGTGISPNMAPLQLTLELHSRLINPLTTIPFSLSSLSLNSNGPDLRPGPTRLRVIELSSSVRRGIADGASGEWKVIKSKGGRGWYVDLSAGWMNGQFVRHLPADHPHRTWLTHLALAQGRVASAVGWHNRKMEIEAFFSLLDEYFASRPHLLSKSPASSPGIGLSNGKVTLPPVSLSTINKFVTAAGQPPPNGTAAGGAASPGSGALSPTSPKSEADLEREAKARQQEKDRMDLALRLGKGAIRGSSAATRGSLNLITKSDKLMGALDKRGAGGLVRGAHSLSQTADGYLRPPKKDAAAEQAQAAGGAESPPASAKKGGAFGLLAGKASALGGGSKTASLPPPTRRTTAPMPVAEPEPQTFGAESQAQAVYDYTGADAGDLSVQTGQIVNVLEKTSADWWTCEDGNGTRGLVPSNYLKEL